MAPLLPELNPSSEQFLTQEAGRFHEGMGAANKLLNALHTMLGILPGVNAPADTYVGQPDPATPEAQFAPPVGTTSVLNELFGLAPEKATPVTAARQEVLEALHNPVPAAAASPEPVEVAETLPALDDEGRTDRVQAAQAALAQIPASPVVLPGEPPTPEAPVFNLSAQASAGQAAYAEAMFGSGGAQPSNVVPFPRPGISTVDDPRLALGA